MVKYLKYMVAMMITMFATSAMAWTPPASPKPAGNIADLAHVLTQSELGRLNTQLRQINSTSANEIGVLILPSLDGQDIRDVGISTAKAWGVGKQGLDNGVMVVWSPGDRKIGIETGKGVEGDLPDLTCNDIIRKVMGPQFRQKNYEAGLSAAFTTISADIEDHRAAVAQRDRENATRNNGDNAATSNGTAPQTSTTPQSGSGCDVAGAPMTHAGLGTGLFWLMVVGGLWFFLRRHRAATRRRQEEELAERQRNLDLRRQELDRLNAMQELQHQKPVVVPVVVPVQPISIPVIRPAEPIVAPTATVSAVAPTWEVAQRIRQEQEEERTRQAHLRQLEQERQEREVEERHQARLQRERAEEAAEEAAAAAALVAAAAVAVSSSDDDDNDSSDGTSASSCSSSSSDDSSSSSDSSDSDFGGGDFGGGGLADSY